MVIYVLVEVSRRELEGRLLLSLAAAERGHDVVLGKIPHAALLSGSLNGWTLPPGVIHLKSVAGAQHIYERFDRLRAVGYRISVQDEEHGLTDADFGAWAERRFPPDALRRVDRILAWGEVDHEWFSSRPFAARPESSMTGSPRMDLWRPDVIGSADSVDARPGHILFVSSTSPFTKNPFWVQVHNRREGRFGPSFEGDEDADEFAMYARQADAFRFVGLLVRAIRRVARAHPERKVIIRPHHFEEPGAWEAAIGPGYANVSVRPDGTARSWIRDAAVVVQGGSTTALEATVARRPLVSFVPDGIMADSVANMFGTRVSDLDGLVDAVDEALHSPGTSGSAARTLAGRIAALEGRLAADRIVDVWESMDVARSGVQPAYSVGESGRVLPAAVAKVRALLGGRVTVASRSSRMRESGVPGDPLSMEVAHKFPDLDMVELLAGVERISKHLDRFRDVRIQQIGRREVLLRKA